MIKQLRRDLSLYSENIFVLPLCSVFCLVFGVAIGILLVRSEGEWVYIGTIMMLFMMLCLGMLFAGFQFLQEARMALAMSRTRRDFIASFVLRQLLMYVLDYVMVLIFYYAERLFYARVFPQYTCAFDIPVLNDWRWIVAVGILWIVLPIMTALLYWRFGKPVTVTLWIVWMGACVTTSRWIDPVLSAVATVPAAVWLAGYLAVLAAAVTVIVVLFKKYAVR